MSTINVQPIVNANGETILNVFTEMGLYVCTLGPDFLMKMNEKNQQGSRIFGFGNFEMDSTSRFQITNHYNERNLYLYFYKSKDGAAVLFNGKIPAFLDAALNCDSSMITAKVGNKVDTSKLTSTKEGLIKERLGVFNLAGSWCGITAYWPQGYGTGEFDSCCVSLVDLETLQNNSNIASDAVKGAIFAGVCFAVDNSTDNGVADSKVISYVRNNVDGVTDANTMLIKFAGRAGIWDYNMLTGEITQSANTYDGYFGIWGQPQYVIDGVLYGLTNGETASTAVTTTAYYLFSYNLSTGASVKGSSSYTMNEATSLLKVGSDLYLNKNSYSISSTSTSYKPAYTKVTLSSLAVSSTSLTITQLSYLTSPWKISSFDDGTYIFHDLRNMISYKFTDISNIAGSIVEPYFVCCGQPVTSGEKTVFMAAHYKAFYYLTPTATTAGNPFTNVSYKGCKYMILDGSVGPLLAYGQFSKTYEKPADADFTSNYYITVQAVNQ